MQNNEYWAFFFPNASSASSPPGHTVKVESSPALAYWYACPTNKRIKTFTRAPATQWQLLHLCSLIHYSTILVCRLSLVSPLSSWPSNPDICTLW